MKKMNRVLFMGSKQLGLRVLHEMYSLSPDTLIGILTIDDTNDIRSVFNAYQDFAKKNELDLHIAKNRMQSEHIIEELKPDLCIVVCWYWLISKTLIEAVPHGFIGIHNSLLPKLRGGSPLIWAILSNEKEVAFSLFSFSPGMDDGPIWAQESVPLEEHDYVSDVLKKLEDKVIEVLRKKYLQLLNGSLSPTEQKHELATYCAQRYPHDGNIDWQKPAQDVYNFVRAQSDPYPGSFTYFEAKVLTIWKAKLFKRTYYGTPGQVARIARDGVYVICGDHHAIILEEVELEGKRGKANDFIKSIKGRMSNFL